MCIIMRNDKMALYYTEIAAKTWISLSKGTKPLIYRKDHARSKLRSFHVKIIVCRSFIEEEEDGENRGLADFRVAR